MKLENKLVKIIVSKKYDGSGCRIELKVATLIDLNATICDNLIKSCDTLYFPSFPPSKFSQNPFVHYKCTTGTSSKSTFWQPKWCFFRSLSCDNLRHRKIFQKNCLVFPENQFKIFSRFYSQSSYWNAQNPTGFLKNWLENLKLFFRKNFYFYRKPLWNVSEIFQNLLRILRMIVIVLNIFKY